MNITSPMSAFEDAYQGYYQKIYTYIRARVESVEVAQDITQNVFVAAYCNWHTVDYSLGNGSQRAWLYCIARNKLKNHYRDKKDLVSLEVLGDDETFDIKSNVHLQTELLVEQRSVLIEVLNQLPERTREIIILRYFASKSTREIATILKISEGNVRVILTRGLKKLAEKLIKNGYAIEE